MFQRAYLAPTIFLGDICWNFSSTSAPRIHTSAAALLPQKIVPLPPVLDHPQGIFWGAPDFLGNLGVNFPLYAGSANSS